MIEGKNLSYQYKIINDKEGEDSFVEAVKDSDISVKRGEFVTILGCNGSGKSTLAKMFNALLLPSSGTLYINKLDVSDEDNTWNIRQSAGMVFQNPDNQIIASIVEEDVAFGPENLGLPADEIKSRVEKSLSLTEMLDFKHKSTAKLSGGQKQRISISSVLAMQPECVILDEPTAMLDPSGREEVIEAVQMLNEKGITIVLITHFMEEALLSDRIFIIDNGSIIRNGTPREIFKEVELMKGLGLDVPYATKIASLLRDEGVDIPDDILTEKELVEALCKLK